MALVVVVLAVQLICPAIKHNASAERRETHVRTGCLNLLSSNSTFASRFSDFLLGHELRKQNETIRRKCQRKLYKNNATRSNIRFYMVCATYCNKTSANSLSDSLAYPCRFLRILLNKWPSGLRGLPPWFLKAAILTSHRSNAQPLGW